MITEALVYTVLGVALGYGLGTKERRAKVIAKMNEWTKPKKVKTEKGPGEP